MCGIVVEFKSELVYERREIETEVSESIIQCSIGIPSIPSLLTVHTLVTYCNQSQTGRWEGLGMRLHLAEVHSGD